MRANIIICNYNYEKFVCDAIHSALAQSYRNLQVTIVDDCSTDKSVQVINDTFFKGVPHSKEVIKGFETKLVNIDGIDVRFIPLKQNSGPSFARNAAILTTIKHTDVFFILDSDDIYYKNKVARCLAEIALAPNNIGVVYTDYDIQDVDTGVTARTYKEVYSKDKLMRDCIVHSGAAITKKAIVETAEKTGFYDNRIKGPEDYDLWLRIAEKFMIIHIPESHSLVRITGHSISSANNPQFNENYVNGFNIIRQKVADRDALTRN